MHGDRRRTSPLGHDGERNRKFLADGVSPPELAGNRDRNRIDNPLDDFAGEIGRGHELAAVAFRNDLSGGTAHIDVEVCEALAQLALDPCGLPGHDIGFVAEQLHGDDILAVRQIEQTARLFVRIRKPFGRHHFGIGDIGALLAAQSAKRRIGNARHGGEQYAPLFEERSQGIVRFHAVLKPYASASGPTHTTGLVLSR